ncbi:chitinase [Paenibacillus shirakamiensis]|uniref:chitinase n=1 Tax=Paenibacillus shirakamiensis TaxID=1265935 RepID=A0ABS4JGZ3_9BACL|nr:glycosyl hydrolase family 18 protein [Paenibacillus shirakamiensis]MBP2000991.1 chitinase [Paenibacillus shirakamiensis]
MSIFKMRGSKAARALAVLSLTAALVIPVVSGVPTNASAADSYKIVGYYPSWAAYGRAFNVTDIDASKVDFINYAFADIAWNGRHGNPDPTGPNSTTWPTQDEKSQTINVPNGTIVLGDPWIDGGKSFAGDTWDQPLSGNLNQLIQLKKKNPNLKTIISVGGWTWSNRFSDVAATQATREVFANSAVDFIHKYSFDGVDLDWEYPVSGGLAGNSYSAADKQNYTLLLQEIRNKLDAAGAKDGKKYYLTIASGASNSYINNTELDKINKIVDWINIMTYDFNGGWQTISAHNAPLYLDPAAVTAGVPNADTFNVDTAVTNYLKAGVTASKLVLGLPFYGRGWDGIGATNNGEYQTGTGASQAGTWENGVFDFNDLEANYINKNGYTRYWNDTAKVPFLYNPSNKRFISYDDAQSIGIKADYIKSKGLGGGMFWELSSDRNKTLQNKLRSVLGTPATTGDTQAPTAPAGLTSTAKTSNSVTLSWTASTDNVGVTGYDVYNGSTLAASVTGTTATISGLTANTAYSFTVKAKDAANNSSAASSAVSVTTSAGTTTDTQAPTAPTALSTTAKTATSVSLSWGASTDNVGVTGYNIYNGSTLVTTVTGTSATVSSLTANTAYSFTVKAKDAAGNLSAASSALSVTTNAATTTDTQAPTAPASLTSTAKTTTSVSLSWNAATDNVGVTGYDVYNGSTLAASVTGTSATVSGLTAGTTYSFTVKAKDAAGNVSAASSALSVKTTDATTTPGGATAWAPGVAYTAGQLVTYNGKTYKVLQPHTSLNGWEPSNVPALFQLQ